MNFAHSTWNRETPIVQITWLVSEKWYSIHKCSASLYTPAKPAKPKAGVQIPSKITLAHVYWDEKRLVDTFKSYSKFL